MQQGPKFGYGPGCGGGEVYTAFVHCAHFQVLICEVDERKKAAENTCRSRAEARAQDERREKKEEEERQLLADRLKKANDITDVVRSLPAAISDPRTYFLKALGTSSPILKDLFRSSDLRSDSVNPDLGSELYRFAQNYAKTGIQTTSNPLIRTIQQEALKQLGERHKKILEQADALSQSLSEFTEGLPRSSSATNIAPGSVKVPTLPRSIAGCEIFNDEEASRKLMQRDRQLWLQLYSKCAK